MENGLVVCVWVLKVLAQGETMTLNEMRGPGRFISSSRGMKVEKVSDLAMLTVVQKRSSFGMNKVFFF